MTPLPSSAIRSLEITAEFVRIEPIEQVGEPRHGVFHESGVTAQHGDAHSSCSVLGLALVDG
jgi:hypothetical protein